MKRRTYVRTSSIAAVMLAVLTFAAAVHAQLLSLPKALPLITFDSAGVASYDGALFSVNASALRISFVAPSPITPPVTIFAAGGNTGFGTMTIGAQVNAAGVFVGGISGDDVVITGRVTAPGLGVVDGVLLTGEVKAFGYHDSPDEFDMRVSITGGHLASFFLGINDLYVPVASPNSTFTGSFAAAFTGGAQGTAGATPKIVEPLPPPPPPVLTLPGNITAEATSPDGAVVAFAATAVDAMDDPLAVICAPASGSVFPFGTTTVNCETALDPWEQIAEGSFTVTVQDTTAPILFGDDVEVQATSASGAKISLPVTACNFLAATPDPVNPCDGEPLAVTCTAGSGTSFDPATEFQFPIGSTTVNCSAIDPSGNPGVLSPAVTVTVKDKQPPAPREGCFIVDFREITFFKDKMVIMSSDADIRASAGIAGMFDPSVWPYRATGGAGYTKSRPTLFRIYGFQPAELDEEIPNADDPWTTYVVRYDGETKGYYADLGGPARAIVCAEQLQEYVLTGKRGNGHKNLSTLLPWSQRNVPGIMLSHNAQIVKLPKRVRAELYQLGLDVGARGMIDYIGFQLQGDGNAAFREFVDVEISFPSDSETDRVQHYTTGFHTALNTNFESFAGCNYVDYAPGNDAARLRDVWGPNRSMWWNYGASLACGSREPSVNQKQRANYDVAFNAVQLLPTVNTKSDTTRLFFGQINPIPEREQGSRDHKVDWSEWDQWDD